LNGLNLQCGTSYRALAEAVRRGLVDESVVDANVLRLLEARYRLGEMDGVSPWDNLDPALVEGPEHRALSLRMAEESIVLLQNRGNILPLSGDSRIALLGPNGDYASMQWGNYNPVPKTTVTLLDAMKTALGDIRYIKGCGHTDALEDIDSLLQELAEVDVVVFAGGISPRLEGEEMNVEIPGFSGGDRTDIELPAVQRRLLAALHDAGKKVVLVNFSGSAMGLVPETESCDAILQAWYPGQDGGTAIVNVLMGNVSPSGKLPVTFYRSVADLPDAEDYNMEGHTYRYFRGDPLYPFGFGLSYTEFSYGKPFIRGNSLVVPVKNTGKRDADEVVQLYVSRPDDPQGPVRTLRDWKRVSIPAGKTVKVSFKISDNTFVWWSSEAQKMLPLFGTYLLQAGPSSAEAQSVEYSYSESFL
jgi:beta-glucosidase